MESVASRLGLCFDPESLIQIAYGCTQLGRTLMRSFFVFFFVSGFCSILYEIIWLRLAMSQFGVTSALVSIVLSMFMAGLGLGSWASGVLIRKYEGRIQFPALRLYALTELLIGVSPSWSPTNYTGDAPCSSRPRLSSSVSYYLVSGLWGR